MLLFNRERAHGWRKGYVGPQATQVWTFDTASRAFRRLSKGARPESSPLWHPDGKRYYYVGEEGGVQNLYRRDLAGAPAERVTNYEQDGVLIPTISRDGSTIVFRRDFDLYRLSTVPGSEPVRIDLLHAADEIHARTLRQQLSTATQVAFADDAREIAFIAGGDLWVMDSELREPRRITNTPGEERDPVFAPDFGSIIYVSEDGDQCDIYRATRKDPKRHWWQNEEFETQRLTNDARPEFAPRFLPDGRIAFTRLRGDLWTMKPDGEDRSLVFLSWSRPYYSFSPDGAWVAYAVDDDDFNSDIWIRRSDGSGQAVNITRHPDWEGDPVWSPDGKILAFLGRRNHDETDIHYVYLRKEDDDRSSRDRTLEKAAKKMKGRKVPAPEKKQKKAAPKAQPKSAFERLIAALAAQNKKPAPKKKKDAASKPKEPMRIDFEGIHDRIRRVPILNVSERDLFWSHDSQRLAFTAKIDGKEGIHTVSLPDSPRPKFFSSTRGSGWRWLKEGNQIVGLGGRSPDVGQCARRGQWVSVPRPRRGRPRAAQSSGVRPLLARHARQFLRPAPEQPRLEGRRPKVPPRGRRLPHRRRDHAGGGHDAGRAERQPPRVQRAHAVGIPRAGVAREHAALRSAPRPRLARARPARRRGDRGLARMAQEESPVRRRCNPLDQRSQARSPRSRWRRRSTGCSNGTCGSRCAGRTTRCVPSCCARPRTVRCGACSTTIGPRRTGMPSRSSEKGVSATCTCAG